jgi:hypothetical protein
MTQTQTKQREISEVNRVVDAPPRPVSWRTLYRAAGVAALITAVLVPIQLAVFMAYPFPDTVTGWFELLQDNPVAGLVNLDLLLVVDNVLLVVIALALYVARRSGRTARLIGSPGRSLRVTFWKLEAGGGDWSSGTEVGAMAAAAGRADRPAARTTATRVAADLRMRAPPPTVRSVSATRPRSGRC